MSLFNFCLSLYESPPARLANRRGLFGGAIKNSRVIYSPELQKRSTHKKIRIARREQPRRLARAGGSSREHGSKRHEVSQAGRRAFVKRETKIKE